MFRPERPAGADGEMRGRRPIVLLCGLGGLVTSTEHDQVSVLDALSGRLPAPVEKRIIAAHEQICQCRTAAGNARYNDPGSMTSCRRSRATLAALVSGVALIFAQPVDMTGRIRAEGQQRSRALALFRTLTDDIARD